MTPVQKINDIAIVTDYVANGSFASLKKNVKYLDEPGYAILIRFTDNTKNWNGDYKYVSKRAFDFLKKSTLFPGDLIIANVGDPGKLFIVPDLKMPMTLGPNSILVRPKIKDLNTIYLAKYFESPVGKSQIKRIISSTAQTKFNKTSFRELLIPLPPLCDQIRIATLLNKVESLIAKRKKSIEDLDELLKSTFLEMFGDPVNNDMGWDKKELSKVANSRLGKMRDKKFITGNYLRPYLGNSNVRWFDILVDDLLEMDFNKKERLVFSLEYGDLLVCEGGEIGRCAIWKNQLSECFFQKALHRVRVKKLLKPEFLQYVFWFYANYNGFRNVSNKATILHLTGEKLKETEVPIPPLNLQNKFATIVEKVEFIKNRYHKSLTDLENLYGALSQKAFKGELDLSRIPLEKEADAQQEMIEPQIQETVKEPQEEITATPEDRDQVLRQMFDKFLSGRKGNNLSLEDFWAEAEEKFMDVMDDETLPLGMKDYDTAKQWLFELLESDEVSQSFNEAENRMEIHINP